MDKAAVIPMKKPGPAATGKGEPVVVRMQPPSLAALDAWIGNQKPPHPTRPEAIRQLVEIGLSTSPPAKRRRVLSTTAQGAARAAELAADTIDKKIDPKAPSEEREVRKRKLIQGPSPFRDARKDRPGK